VTPDGKFVVTMTMTAQAHAVVRCDLTTRKAEPLFDRPAYYATRTRRVGNQVNQTRRAVVQFSPDGRVLAQLDEGASVRLCDVATGGETHHLGADLPGVEALTFAADGKTLATVHADGSFRLWDVAAGTEKRRFAGDK